MKTPYEIAQMLRESIYRQSRYANRQVVLNEQTAIDVARVLETDGYLRNEVDRLRREIDEKIAEVSRLGRLIHEKEAANRRLLEANVRLRDARDVAQRKADALSLLIQARAERDEQKQPIVISTVFEVTGSLLATARDRQSWFSEQKRFYFERHVDSLDGAIRGKDISEIKTRFEEITDWIRDRDSQRYRWVTEVEFA